MSNERLHTGYAALIGRPNVGKSTLLNAVLGVKLCITSDKPQTTRNRVLGVHTVEGRGQVIFVDTPGIHTTRRRFNQRMVDASLAALRETDLAVVVVDATTLDVDPTRSLFAPADVQILAEVEKAGRPRLLVLNQCDRLSTPQRIPTLLQAIRDNVEHAFDAVVPVSALRRRNLPRLEDALFRLLPEGPLLFAADALTDRSERFLAAEILREKVVRQTHQEVPYSVAVSIDTFAESIEDGKLHIHAVIHVEKESQKGILIGRAGTRLRELGIAARRDLARFFQKEVVLQTQVRVEENWTEREQGLDRFGYTKDEI
jgi:GTP-binding protein Era